MWSALFAAFGVTGAMFAFKGWKNRDGPTWPEGVAPGTPVKEWPKQDQRDRLDYEAARHWSRFLIGGLFVLAIGIGGTVLEFIDTVSEAGKPSREELIEFIATDSNNTYDREEATCVLDSFDSLGIDLLDDLPREEFLAEFAQATSQLSLAELVQLDSCLDDESRASRRSAITDTQIRETMIALLQADPSAAIDDVSAKCLVDLLDERGLLRDVLDAGQALSPGLEEALVDAESLCF